jgi:hypothetical protein
VLQYFYYMDAKITIDYKERGSKFPVAVEFGTTDYLYLHKRKQDKEEEKPIKNRYDLKFKDYEEAIKRNGIKGKEKHSVMEHLEEMYFSNIQGDDKYKDLQKIVEEKEGKKFKAKKKLIPVLRKNWFDVVYINGRSGAGKTKFLVRMVNAYLKTLTKKEKPEIYLISKKEKDAMIDDNIKGIQRLDVNTFLEEPMTIDEIPDKSVIIFDDYEQYEPDRPLFKLIIGFLNDLMTMGRTKLLKIFIISHLPTFGKDSTLTFIEASWFVFYPTKTAYSSLEYVLNKKVGWELNEIKKIKGLKRVVVNKDNKFIIYDKFVELI